MNNNELENFKERVSVVNNEEFSTKSRVVAGLLGIFFGGLGVHNFYLENIGRGVSQILVTLTTCFTGAVWGFIEGLLLLFGVINEDGQGKILN